LLSGQDSSELVEAGVGRGLRGRTERECLSRRGNQMNQRGSKSCRKGIKTGWKGKGKPVGDGGNAREQGLGQRVKHNSISDTDLDFIFGTFNNQRMKKGGWHTLNVVFLGNGR
jgi:hypothetical protein